jgi:hypothetical protein
MSKTSEFTFVAATVAMVWLTALSGVATAGPAVANSVTDFSGTQGLHGWSYGYYDGDAPSPYTPADFEPLPVFDGTKWLIQETPWLGGPGPPPNGYWTRLTATGGHPNGNLTTTALSANHWAARRWTSSRQALYTISGIFADDSPALNPPPPQAAYNGVIGHIFVDGTEVLTLPINEGGNTPYSFSLPLSAGSMIDFAIDAKIHATDPDRTSDWTDSTTFTVQIFVPEPSSLHLATVICFGWSAILRRRGAASGAL